MPEGIDPQQVTESMVDLAIAYAPKVLLQIFNTVVKTSDSKTVIMANGGLST